MTAQAKEQPRHRAGGHLTLTRSPGEGITIKTPSGDVIHITYDGDTRGEASLTFSAPRHIKIARDELLTNPPNHLITT